MVSEVAYQRRQVEPVHEHKIVLLELFYIPVESFLKIAEILNEAIYVGLELILLDIKRKFPS